MENTLLKKLQIKAGFKVKVVNAPENISSIISAIPSDIELSSNLKTEFDGLLIFAISKADLISALNVENIATNTICWILYPKAKSKLACDLNLMQSWEDLKAFNLTPCGSAAIDETWTALRIKPISELKRSGLGNTEIAQNDFGNYIDVANKIINLPEDLELEIKKQPSTYDFFQSLSYSNRKEYVLWVLSAKQEKTRIDRITKTVEKLSASKKNPSEK